MLSVDPNGKARSGRPGPVPTVRIPTITDPASNQLFRYAGRTLAEWLPAIVARVAERFDPERIVLFGSLARGDAGLDSDIDLLVVFRAPMERRATAVECARKCIAGDTVSPSVHSPYTPGLA